MGVTGRIIIKSFAIVLSVAAVAQLAGCRRQATVNPLPASMPVLLSPPEGEVIPQNQKSTGCPEHATRGYGIAIRFEWSRVPDAASYHLVLQRRGSQYPAVDTTTKENFHEDRRCNSFVIDPNLDGWEWRVTAVRQDGTTIGVSPTRSLRFGPCVLAGGRGCHAAD